MRFSEILDIQQDLNSKINVSRQPDKNDSINSLIAEIMEWNEASKATHKVWKDKPYSEHKQSEEYVDILICFARYCNKLIEDLTSPEGSDFQLLNDTVDLLNQKWEEKWNLLEKLIEPRRLEPATTSTFMKVVLQEDPINTMEFYIITALRQGYTREKIESGFMEKIAVNYERIGADWK